MFKVSNMTEYENFSNLCNDYLDKYSVLIKYSHFTTHLIIFLAPKCYVCYINEVSKH